MIVSNGFSFQFNVQEKLGYIVPEWVSSPETAIPSSSSSQDTLETGMTHFYLPLKPTVVQNRDREFDPRELFENIDHVILFLRRLKTLELQFDDERKVLDLETEEGPDAASSEKKTIHLRIQRFKGDELVSSHRFSYRIARHVLDVPEELQDEESSGAHHSGQKTTEIVLAFPMKAADNSEDDEEPASSCAIYTFLPVRAVGFRFIVNADFQLVTSRQGLSQPTIFVLQWSIKLLTLICFRYSQE
jgi:hypothetical protein